MTPATASSFQAGQFFISVLCATLVHALILSAAGTWLGLGGEGSGGPMLMALELSGGNGPGTRAGGQPGPVGAPKMPLDAAAAQASVTENAPQALPLPASTSKAQDRKISPPAVPAPKKPKPKALAKTSATPSPPSKALPEQIAPLAQEPAKTDAHEAANGAIENSSEASEGPSETAGAHSGVARQPQSADSGSGASGNGVAGAVGGGGTAGDSGKGGNLIRFNSPGGPGIVRMTQPRYPYEAKRLGKEGVVVLKLSLDETGSISDVEVLKGGDFGMAEASREAVMLSRFRPATVKGRPVACQAILPIHFKLR